MVPGTVRRLVRSGVLPLGVLAGAAAACGGEDAATVSSVEYRDGTYSADGVYGNGPSSIGVTLTVADGVVTDARVETHATNPTSLDLQERFAEAVPDVVVGRPLATLEVDKLAGSSHTPDGFNDALDQIRSRAET